MTYLSGKREQRRKVIMYSLFAIFFFIFIFFWGFFKKNLYGVLEPVVVKAAHVKNSFGFFPEFIHTYFTSHKELQKNVRDLELIVERLENDLAEKNGQLREVSLLIASSGTPVHNPPLILYPLMEDVTKLYSTILLSKGFEEGIEVGDLAYVRGMQAACIIKEVYTSSSLCLLLTSSEVRTEGVTSSSTISLTLMGRGGYYMANIVRDTPVEKGELVYLRDNPNMVIGEVVEVSNNNQDTSWHVFVRGAYNPVTSSVFYVQK